MEQQEYNKSIKNIELFEKIGLYFCTFVLGAYFGLFWAYMQGMR